MKQRIVTAIIALGVFLPAAIYGGWPFSVLVYTIAAVGLFEFLRMRQNVNILIPGLISVSVLLLFISLPANIPFINFAQSDLIVLFVLAVLLFTVISKNKFTFDDAAFMMMATFYVGIGFFYMLETRLAGLDYFFYVLLIIWMTDTGAYFFGRAFGKHKLWPEISPNKTIEGAIGGVLSACIIAVVYNVFVTLPVDFPILIGTTILASIFGQLGDLVESAFKRHYGVKDTGRILPGHGGVLDRFDSMLFVFPFLHLIGFIA
ncbi:phosphatidate cytidylyltransferase [Lentibacillus saliphilus]|uniref:phosphatidate cytidylyltransferase n=1 Tax=Lentibacillus saliphilus TaxID=2737028 RepID=UPI001C2FA4A3|nr:phosphatidate cytidylyltransferase [Lentibacillus saliphilus]